MRNTNVNRWSVVIAGVIILMCLGVAYSWGVFLIPVNQDMEWGRTKIAFAVSILLLVFSVFMSVGGFLEKKIGPRKTAGIGGTLVALGWILASFSQSPLTLYLCYGIIAGIGTGLSYMPSISTGIKWFPDKKGLVTGIIVFGFGFGTAFLSPVITKLINLYGWRNAMMLCGLAFWLIISLAVQFLKAPSNSLVTTATTLNDKDNYLPLEMIGTPAFKMMFLTYFISMVAGMMTIGHLVAFAVDKNFTPMQGALALTILSISNGVGRIFSGYISDFWGGKRVLIILFTLIGLAMFGLYHAGAMLTIYFLSIIIGFCFGGFLAVYPVLTAEYFGDRDFAVNYGLIFIGYGSGCFLGPLIGGWVYDIFENYLIAFYFAGGLALIGGALIFLLQKPCSRTKKEDAWKLNWKAALEFSKLQKLLNKAD